MPFYDTLGQVLKMGTLPFLLALFCSWLKYSPGRYTETKEVFALLIFFFTFSYVLKCFTCSISAHLLGCSSHNNKILKIAVNLKETWVSWLELFLGVYVYSFEVDFRTNMDCALSKHMFLGIKIYVFIL